jgi:hypothetical protein
MQEGSKTSRHKHCGLQKARIAWLVEHRSIWENKNLSDEDKNQLRLLMTKDGLGGNVNALYWPIFQLLSKAKMILDKADDNHRPL